MANVVAGVHGIRKIVALGGRFVALNARGVHAHDGRAWKDAQWGKQRVMIVVRAWG